MAGQKTPTTKLWVSAAPTHNPCVIKSHTCFYLGSQGSESGDGQTRESQEGENQSKSNPKRVKTEHVQVVLVQ